jgi:hypothetical protein
MNREKLLRALMDSVRVKCEQSVLETLDDEQLKGLASASGIDCGCGDERDLSANSEGDEGADGDSANDDADDLEDGEAIPEKPALGAEDAEFVTALRALGTPQEIADAITMGREAKANAAATKEAIVARLVTNEDCTISKADLEAMPVTALKALETQLLPNDFSGLALRGTALASGGSNFVDTVPVFLREANTDREG